jgi:hypothetical protein
LVRIVLAVRLSAIAAVQEMTQGGAESVLEFVGGEPSMATAMTHIATQEVLDGKPMDWMEKVSDSSIRHQR